MAVECSNDKEQQPKRFLGYIWGHVGVPWFLALDFKRSRNPGTESVSVHRIDATAEVRLLRQELASQGS